MGASSRRQFVGRAGALAAAATVASTNHAEASEEPGRKSVFRPPAGPRYRVISDNDYSGDPDGLFQLVHVVLSPSLDVRAVIGSHLAVGDGFDPSTQQAANAVRRAQTVLGLMGLRGRVRVVQGSNVGLVDASTPQRSAGAQAIVAEAMRTDTNLPLFVTFGAGLTELASAYLIEPRIADRLTAVWIGGPEYPELGPHPERPGAGPGPEYNLNIDVTAAQVVFNDSTIPLWQVPRNAYRQALVSMTELAVHVRPRGKVGAYLYDALVQIHQLAANFGLNLGETYILGDNPLVLLTALQSQFEPNTSSSEYAVLHAPRINDDGTYTPRSDGREIRVYIRLDLRLMFEDFYAKLAAR
jgi:Inosine-uridine preferring nucleoside hydrolase